MKSKVNAISKNIKMLFIAIPITAVIIFLLTMFFMSAVKVRNSYIEYYDKGVQYYEDGDYYSASEVFKNLRGWGENIVEIRPEEYYKMSIGKILEENPNIERCPNCGYFIHGF